jgi:PST family polysaccharide transporter
MGPTDKFEAFAGTTRVRQDLKRTAVRAFTSVLTSTGGEFVLRIASTAILARILAPEQFGLFIMVTAITAVGDQFRDLGLSAATIQRESISHEEVSNLFWVNILAGSSLTAIAFVCAPLVASYYHEPRLTSLTMLFSTNFVLGAMIVQHEALLTRQMKHGRKALVRLLASLVSTILAVALAAWGFGPWALVWRELARSLLIVIGVFMVCPWIPGLPDRHTNIRSLLHFGKDVTGTNIFGALGASLDRLLIGRFFGAEPVAMYRQPYQLVVTPMAQFMSPLYQVALPSLSMLQSEGQRYRRLYRKIVAVVAMLSVPLSLFIAIYADEVTAVVLGRRWTHAAIFLRVFALGGIIRSVYSTIGFVLITRGHSRPYLMLGIVNSVVLAAFMSIGVIWGPMGVAVGDLATLVVMCGPWMFYSFRGSPVSTGLFFSALWRPVVASSVMGIAALTVKYALPFSSPYPTLIAGSIAGLLALIVAWLSLPGGQGELQELIDDVVGAVRRRRGDSHAAEGWL